MAILQGKKILAGAPVPKTTENKIIEITKSAYEELEAENKVLEDQIYLIKDEDSANAVINDIDIGLETAYSSQHTQLLLDEKVSKTNSYTKSEVNSLINSKLNVISIDSESSFRLLHSGNTGIKITADINPSGTSITIPADTLGTCTADNNVRHFIGNDQSGNVYSWIAKQDGTNTIRKI